MAICRLSNSIQLLLMFLRFPMALELDRVVKIQLTLIEYSEGDAV